MNRILLAVLLLAVVGTAIAVVYERYRHRQLFVELTRAERERDELNIEFGRLQLEQGKKPAYLYVSLILTMILGRLVWGAAASVVFPLAGADFGMKIFYTAAVLNAIPGILLQIVIIPPILYALQRAKLLKAAPNA